MASRLCSHPGKAEGHKEHQRPENEPPRSNRMVGHCPQQVTASLLQGMDEGWLWTALFSSCFGNICCQCPPTTSCHEGWVSWGHQKPDCKDACSYQWSGHAKKQVPLRCLTAFYYAETMATGRTLQSPRGGQHRTTRKQRAEANEETTKLMSYWHFGAIYLYLYPQHTHSESSSRSRLRDLLTVALCHA